MNNITDSTGEANPSSQNFEANSLNSYKSAIAVAKFLKKVSEIEDIDKLTEDEARKIFEVLADNQRSSSSDSLSSSSDELDSLSSSSSSLSDVSISSSLLRDYSIDSDDSASSASTDTITSSDYDYSPSPTSSDDEDDSMEDLTVDEYIQIIRENLLGK